MIRDGAACFTLSYILKINFDDCYIYLPIFIHYTSNISVHKKWPKWLTPSCISKSSSVFHWGHTMIPANWYLIKFDTTCLLLFILPALLIRRWIFGCWTFKFCAAVLIELREAKSNLRVVTEFLVSEEISLAASSAFWISLQAITTWAPSKIANRNQ